jgi:phosphatidylserine/phosphatidylglycerophosphate/cardiolipin synthase-like enzyme
MVAAHIFILAQRIISMPRKKPSDMPAKSDIITLISQIKDWRVLLLIIVLILIVFWFSPPQEVTAPPPDSTDSTELDQGTTDGTQVVQLFNTTAALIYPDKADARTPPPLYTAFLNDISAATQSIDIAVFDIDLPELGQALLDAHARGVTVRVAFDDENLEDARVAALIGDLQDAGIAVQGDGREPFMHEKIAVIDSSIVWTGSWNMTMNDTYRNNNFMWRIVNPSMATSYRQEIDQLMSGTFGTYKTSYAPHPKIPLPDGQIEYFFSPEDGINQYVVEALNNAQSRIVFMAFSYTDKLISQAMIDAHNRGVSVQGVMEAQNANGTGAVFNTLADADIDILRDGNCYIMHHKTIIIDDELVITGSYNFTKSAEKSNDENLLMIRSPQLATQALAEYTRVRTQAEEPLTCGR